MTKRWHYIRVGHLWGAPVDLQWAFPLTGAVLLIEKYHELWKIGGYILVGTSIIFIHELGHAVMARLLKVPLIRLEVSSLSGLCHVGYPQQIKHSALIWSAGLLAQLAVLLLTWLHVSLYGWPLSDWGAVIAHSFTGLNICIMVMNLIPHDVKGRMPNDGKVLWQLYRHVWHHRPLPPVVLVAHEMSPVFPPEQRLLALSQFRNDDFVQGVEILNDASTTMEFVMDVLSRHLGLGAVEATQKMLDIHNLGGVLIPVNSPEAAHSAVVAITADIQAAGASLICRYADVREERSVSHVG